MTLIPPNYLKSIVSIEIEQDQNGERVKSSIATGFLVGKATGEKQGEEPLYKFYLVTNRHVYQNPKTKTLLKEVYFRFNTKDNKSHYFKTSLLKDDGTPNWLTHSEEKVDLAVLPINAQAIVEAGIEYFAFVEGHLFYAKDFEKNNISTGDDLFVLGFPMRISGRARNYVIARSGIVARVDEEVLNDFYYYIDAAAYPGNSGGPVIHKPEVVAIGGTNSNSNAGLMGVISSGETYSDVAISQQTGEARIVFTEQTGLVRVVPVELIFEIIDAIPKPEVNKSAEVKDAGSEEVTEE